MSRDIRFQYIRNSRGSIIAVFVIMLTVLSSFLLAAAALSLENRLSVSRSYQKNIALNIAEAGVNKAMWELKGHNLSYSGETGNSSISGGEFDVTVTPIDPGNKYIISTAYVPTKANPKFKKAIKVKISDKPVTENASFNYAIQAGSGGIFVTGNAEVEGSLYSNGGISVSAASANIHDRGDAWAVGSISDPHDTIDGVKTSPASPVDLPQIDLNSWKNIARAGGTISGNYSPPSTGTYTDLGPKEIVGDMNMSSTSQKINLLGPLYIHGNLTLTGGYWKIDDSMGSNGTIVIVDGKIDIGAGSTKSKFLSNSSNAYILFISTSTENSEGSSAIGFTGGLEAEKLALYAYYGSMKFSGGGKIVAMTGQTLYLTGGGKIDYESGLANVNFAGGPGGTWSIKEWQEITPP
ncbi:MAG: hypothetical protein Q7S53_04785 [bacterium]|nr:hypothetical protein [bacterium]